MKKSKPLGVGLSFNPTLAEFVANHAGTLDFLEISPERFWHDRGPQYRQNAIRYKDDQNAVTQLESVRSHLPIIAHGVGLSIATVGALDIGHIEQISRWHRNYHFEWYSEHLAYFRLGPNAGWKGIGVMLPPTYDKNTLKDIQIKAQEINDILGIEFLLENAVNYTPNSADICEGEFLNSLAKNTAANLLLDLHNLYTNTFNNQQNPYEIINKIDLKNVTELHIAGGEELAGYWTDAHAGRCPPMVWELLEYVLSQPNSVRAVTFEVDESYATQMSDDDFLEEIQRARWIWEKHNTRGLDNVA